MTKTLLRALVLSCVFCVTFIVSNAQWAPVSSVFKSWLRSSHGVPASVFMQSGSNWLMDTTSTYIANDTSIVFDATPFSGDHVDTIEGIQYFDNLKHLSCRNQGIDSLPPLSSTLIDLYAGFNVYRSIPPIPNVTTLSCYNTQIHTLPVLSSSLTYLWCHHNALTALPALPNTLTNLNCSYNSLLTDLPALPDSLYLLDCSYCSQLHCLPYLNKIRTLNFNSSGVTCVPNFPQSYVNGLPNITSASVCDSLPFNPCAGLPPPTLQTVCGVTVDSTSSYPVVQWEKTNREATDSFHIYREVSAGVYAIVGAVDGDSLSEFYDYTANPNATAYRYKISVLDTAGTEGAVSVYHNTIHLQSLGGGNLQWTEYLINGVSPVTTYDVYIDAAANGNWLLMISVPSTQTTATDVNQANHPAALYRLAANVPFSCTPARSAGALLSNIISIQSVGIQNYDASPYFKLYPNPANDQLFIQSAEEVKQVNIYNTTGELVMAVLPSTVNCQLSTASLANGVYIAEIKTKDATIMKRWVRM